MPSWANKDYKIVKQITVKKMEENTTKHKTAQLGIAGVVPSFYSSKDWAGDYTTENGIHQNICLKCREPFYGYKHRTMCRGCFYVRG